MQFEIIGADTENYYLMAFDEEMDMSKGVFFYKTPISFFDFVETDQPTFYFMFEIESFIERYYDLLIRDGYLDLINQSEFLDIEINYKGWLKYESFNW